jgi:hypothetical protein
MCIILFTSSLTKIFKKKKKLQHLIKFNEEFNAIN